MRLCEKMRRTMANRLQSANGVDTPREGLIFEKLQPTTMLIRISLIMAILAALAVGVVIHLA